MLILCFLVVKQFNILNVNPYTHIGLVNMVHTVYLMYMIHTVYINTYVNYVISFNSLSVHYTKKVSRNNDLNRLITQIIHVFNRGGRVFSSFLRCY